MPDHYAHPELTNSATPASNHIEQTPFEDRLAPLLERRAAILEAIELATAHKESIDAEIRTITRGVPDTYQASNGMTVQLQVNRRLDAAKVALSYPPASCPELYESKLKTAAIRAILSPVDLEEFYIVGDPKIVAGR